MSVVVSAVTGPWGVKASYNDEAGLVTLDLKYRLSTTGGLVTQWVTIACSGDEVLESLAAEDESRVSDALIALGYELP